MPWTEKYRPKKFEELKGQEEAVRNIKNFIDNFLFSKKQKKALVLHGPPGTGKTTLAYVIAKETNSEIIEVNASDFRNKEKLQQIIKPAIEQQSLTKQNKIILIDEADGISGYYDRGGVQELISLIEETPYPFIITANDVWSKKLQPLRQKTEMIQLKEIDYKIIQHVLFEILKKENLFLNPNIVTSIATRAKGDLRAAINDLQTVSRMQDPSILELDERNKEVDIFNALKLIFKGKPTSETPRIFDQVNMDLDEIMLWLEENIPAEYRAEELAVAYEMLSKADIFKGRIYKQQYWRFLVYQNLFLSYGIAAAKNPKRTATGFSAYKKPSRILKIWMNNQRTFKKKSIAQKYASYVHIGSKRAMNEFPIIKNILKSNQKIQEELRLDEDEIAYLIR